MKKKLSALLLIVILLLVCGCERQYTPDPEVEQFLNTELTAQKAVDAVKAVNYTVTETKLNKNGDEQGKRIVEVSIDKSDFDNQKLEIVQSFFGSYVSDGISYKQIVVQKVDGKYFYCTTVIEDSTSEEVEEQFVIDFITSFFYVNNSAYDEGGLYYGDFFMLNIYKYPATSFSVDVENQLCVFDEKMDIHDSTVGNVHLHQISRINILGLIVDNYERYESVEADLVLVSELVAIYTFL